MLGSSSTTTMVLGTVAGIHGLAVTAEIDRPVRTDTASRSCHSSSVSEICVRSTMQRNISGQEIGLSVRRIRTGRLPPMVASPYRSPSVTVGGAGNVGVGNVGAGIVGGVLGRILASHRVAAGRRRQDVGPLVERAHQSPPPRPFVAALRDTTAMAVIAEIKRRSPSKGILDMGLDPANAARSYADGGAACLSVLTDTEFFGGSPEDLALARAAVGIPVLRKDFTVCEADVCDARIMGADAVLLIVAALSDAELARLSALADELSLAALVEVHDLVELERAMATGPALVGINQRDLVTFEVHRNRACQLASMLPDQVVKVAESGIHGADDVVRLADAGFDAVLVGEALVRAPDRAVAVQELRAAGASHLRGVKTAQGVEAAQGVKAVRSSCS